jgi:hypothetical protein
LFAMTFYKHRPWRSTDQVDESSQRTQGGKGDGSIRHSHGDESTSKNSKKVASVQYNRSRNSHSYVDCRFDDEGYPSGDRSRSRNHNPHWRDDPKKNYERNRFSASAVDFPPTRRSTQRWNNPRGTQGSGQRMDRSFDAEHNKGKGARPQGRRDPHDHSPSKQAHSLGHHPFDVDSSPEDDADAFEGRSPDRRYHHRTATIATPLCSSVPEFSADQGAAAALPVNPLASLLGTASGSGRMNKFRPAQLSALEAQSDSSFIRSFGEEHFPAHRRTSSETSLKEESVNNKDKPGFRVVDARTSAARPFQFTSSARVPKVVGASQSQAKEKALVR